MRLLHDRLSPARLLGLIAALLVVAPATASAAPGAPTGLTAATPTKVKPVLSWTAPVSPGLGLQGYNVYRGTTKVNSAVLTGTTFTDAAAPANQTLVYTVKAVESGTGALSPASAPFSVVYDTTAPPAPTALTATTPTNAPVVLTWNPGAADTLSGFKQYDVYRGTTLVGTATTPTYTDTVSSTATYSYSVKAEDNAGNVSTGPTKSVLFDNVPPATPAGFNPAVAQRTKPTLSWTAALDSGGAGIDHYEVYRSGSPTVDVGGTTGTSFVDASITIEGVYAYYVVAVDKAGNGGPPTAVKTVQYDITAPTIPGGLVAGQTPTAAKPALGWTASTDPGSGTGVTTYRIYRNGTLATTSASVTGTDSGVTADGSYSYYVTAVDAAGNESAPSNQVTVLYDKTAPPTPTGLTPGPSPTNQKPTLTWSSGGPDALSGFAHYDVYRGTVVVGQTTSGSFTDAALSTSGSQSYTVKAVDNAGNASPASTVKTIVYDVTPPPAPGAFTAPAATAVKPTLTWAAVTDTGGSGTQNYNVYRDGTLLGTATNTSYTETDPAYPDGAYVYTVSAVDKAGNEGAPTTPKTVVYDTTAPGPPGDPTTSAPVSKVKPAIAWTAAADPGGSGIATYTVYRNGVQAGTAVGTSFQDTVTLNGTYAYTLRATDGAGNASALTAAVSVVYDTVAPPAPISLSGATPTGLKPALTWLSGGPDTLSGFDHYEIYRAGVLIGTSSSASYTDNGATAGTNVYTVKAADAAGNLSSASTSKTIVYDLTPPGQPTGLTIPSPTNVPQLSWTAPADPSGINHYDVYRDGAVIGSTTLTSYVDTPAPAEGTYAYAVAAIDGAGNAGLPSAARSVTIDVTPPPVPASLTAPTPSAAKPALVWASGGPDTGSGFFRYEVVRNGSLVGTALGTTYTDAGVSTNGTYTYVVRAVDNAGNRSADTTPIQIVWDNTAPPVPTGLTGSTVTAAAPHLQWFTGGPDGLAGFDHYTVYRGGALVGTSTSASFDDGAVATDGSYGYVVKAVDAAGNESGPSNSFAVLRDTASPTSPIITAAPSPTRSQPSLTWSASGDGAGSGVARYDVYRDGAQIASTVATSFTDDAALPDGVSIYTVIAVDAAGNASPASVGAAIRLDTVAPAAPTGLAGATPSNLPHVTWTQASDQATGGSGIGSYRIYRNGAPAGVAATADFQDTQVVLDDAYTYTVTAIDGAGNESAPSAGVVVLFDHTPPPAPAGLGGVQVSQNRPSLTWSSGGPDALSGFDHYEVLRNGAVIGSPATAAFDDNALAVNGSYIYTVRAVDAAGNRSSTAAPRTIVWDTTPPATPTGLTAPDPSSAPALSWDAAPDTGGAGTQHYVVLRDGSVAATVTGTSWVDADGVVAEGVHGYAVQAVDAALNASPVSATVTVTLDRSPPTAPANVTAASPVARPVISFDAAPDQGAVPSGLDHYAIYRGATLAGTTTATTFQDDAAVTDGTFAYTVRAIDRAGNVSAASTAVTVVFDKTPPPIPIHLTAATPSPNLPALSWTTGGADGLSGFDHYEVWRDGNLIATVTAPAFADTGLTAQGPHAYAVRAVDNAGNASAATPALTVVWDATPPPTPTGLQVASPTSLPHLSWDASADDDTGASGIDHYNVYRDGTVVGRATTTTFDDASVALDGSYGYSVTAVDRAGNESLASRTMIVRFDATPPLAVTDLSGASPVQIPLITWSAASDAATGGSTITSYRIYRDGVFLGETTGVSFTDPHPGSSGHRIYAVRAVDGAGNVAPPSTGLDIIIDVDGPQLDNVTFPAQRLVGESVAFSVNPRDALSAVMGQAQWDFGDGFATGNHVNHTFSAEGTYRITVKASDVLGNLTTIADRSITIALPPGGLPPTTIILRPIKSVTLRWLKRTHEIPVTIYVDRGTNLELILSRGGNMVSDRVRRLPAGSSHVTVAIPTRERRKGTLTLTVRATNASLETHKSFRVK